MKLSIISFTNNGIFLSKNLANKLNGVFSEEEIALFTKCSHSSCEAMDDDSKKEETKYVPIHVTESIGEWTRKQLKAGTALLFIGACGIAVRAIAPYITDKLHDSPVLVMDERGAYIIPILSGHMGGANELALQLAERIGAVPVITTATDINKSFAVDLFAKKNGLHIVNKEGIAKVSSKILAEKEISIAIEQGHYKEGCRLPKGVHIVSYPPKQFVDIVITTEEQVFDAAIFLRPKEYAIGMGCRRGKEAEKIESLILRSLKELGISNNQLLSLTSIDQKKDELGLLEWSRKTNIPFITYTAEELQKMEGIVNQSAFVKEQVGVDNVCERAALKACGSTGRLVYEKHAEDGMTIAVAKREWSVVFDEE